MGRRRQNKSREHIEAIKKKYSEKKVKKNTDSVDNIDLNSIHSESIAFIIFGFLLMAVMTEFVPGFDYNIHGLTFPKTYLLMIILFILSSHPKVLRHVYPLVLIQAIIFLVMGTSLMMFFLSLVIYSHSPYSGTLFFKIQIIVLIIQVISIYLIIEKQVAQRFLGDNVGYGFLVLVIYLEYLLTVVLFFTIGCRISFEISELWQLSVDNKYYIVYFILGPIVEVVGVVFLTFILVDYGSFFVNKEVRINTKAHFPEEFDYQSDIFWDYSRKEIKRIIAPVYIYVNHYAWILMGTVGCTAIMYSCFYANEISLLLSFVLFGISMALWGISMYKINVFYVFFKKDNSTSYTFVNNKQTKIRISNVIFALLNTLLFYPMVLILFGLIVELTSDIELEQIGYIFFIVAFLVSCAIHFLINPIKRFEIRIRNKYIKLANENNLTQIGKQKDEQEMEETFIEEED